MKKLLTMIAVLGLVTTVAMATSNMPISNPFDDDTDMYIYYYQPDHSFLGNFLPKNPGDPYWEHGLSDADRVEYEYSGKLWGYDPYIVGFRNQVFYHYDKPQLRVELSDTLLYWDIATNMFEEGSMFEGENTATLLAGIRLDNRTGIRFAVYTGNPSGADITFSQAHNVETTDAGPYDSFPTYYAFMTSVVAPIHPDEAGSQFISASDLNSTTIHVPFTNADWIRYLVSAIKVSESSRNEATYLDDFYITVANVAVP